MAVRNSVKVFNFNDEAFLRWANQHPDGFVLNTNMARSPEFMILHRADCPTIDKSAMADPGQLTGRDYVMICAPNITWLRDWARENGRPDGSFSDHCSVCEPL